MACINTASKIVLHLKPCDRLSLYKSSCSDPLIVSEDIRVQEIKKILDTIDHATTRPRTSYLRHSVEVARKVLRCGEVDGKHIAVLTCNPFALDKVAIDNMTQMHVLCPGPIPWVYSKASANNGWFLLNGPSKFSRSAGALALRDEEIQRMLLQLRSGRALDHLEKVSVTVTPGSSDVLQGVLGATFIETMNVGESRTLLIKFNTQPGRRTASILEHFPNGARTTSGQLDLEREIELMLDHRQTPTIGVKVQYHHSALGSDTLCELTRDIFEHNNVITKGPCSETDTEWIAVQNRMLYHMATSQANPHKALAVLRPQTYENNTGEHTFYLNILLEELKYQARIQERYMLEKNQILPVLQRYNLFPPTLPESNVPTNRKVSLPGRYSEPSPLDPRRISAEVNQTYQTKANSKPRQRGQNSVPSRKAPSPFKHKVKDSALSALRSIGKGQVHILDSDKKIENTAPR